MQKFTLVFLHWLSMYHGHIKNRMRCFAFLIFIIAYIFRFERWPLVDTREQIRKRWKFLFFNSSQSSSSSLFNAAFKHKQKQQQACNYNLEIKIWLLYITALYKDEKQSRYRKKLLSANLAFFSVANYLLKPGDYLIVYSRVLADSWKWLM